MIPRLLICLLLLTGCAKPVAIPDRESLLAPSDHNWPEDFASVRLTPISEQWMVSVGMTWINGATIYTTGVEC